MTKTIKDAKVNEENGLFRVVQVGLEQESLAGISSILGTISQVLSSYGCVLWECSSGTAQGPESTFFALAQAFPGDLIWDQHDIPFESLTGYAIANNLKSCSTTNLWKDPRTHKPEFLRLNGLSQMCTAPLQFTDDGVGALNLFRRDSEPLFDDKDMHLLEQIANILPYLYKTIRDKVGYKLSRVVNRKLQEARPDTEDNLREVVSELCHLVQEHLHCYDVSMFLQDPDGDEAAFLLYGTTLTDREAGSTKISIGDKDPTAYPLHSRSPLRVIDLRRDPYSPEGLLDGTPLSPPSSRYIAHVAAAGSERARHKISLSFVSAPILAGERLLGVMRCCAPISGPTYFAARETLLIMLLAGQIGQFVSDQRNRRELIREIEAKRILVDSVSAIMDDVNAELKLSQPKDDAIVTRSLQTIRAVIGTSDFVGIRHLDPRTMTYLRGQHHPSGTASAAAVAIPAALLDAIGAGRPMLIDRGGLMTDEYSSLVRSLPFEPDQLIVTPIRCGEEFGFLEIAHRGSKELAKEVTDIAGILGRLIGLYNELLRHIALLHRAKENLEKGAKEQEEAFMDLEHQIRAPLRHASWRLPRVLRFARGIESPGAITLVKEIEYLQGIHRRAQRVAGNLRLFTNLASKQAINIDLKPYGLSTIRGFLIAAAMDHQLYSECAGQTVTFDVVRSTLDAAARDLKDHAILLDKRLLEQALDDLLDNASKYSFEGEKVRIEVSAARATFAISIINRGLRIERNQLTEIVKRGERGALAKHTVGEGSGIGLWIVDEVMRAHGGKLDVQATTPEGYNCIRMLIPLKRS